MLMRTAQASRPGFARRRLAECRELARFLRRNWIATAVVVLLYAAAKHWLWINISPSLPYHLVWLERGAVPQRGELMLYRFSGEVLAGADALKALPLFKRTVGLPGDVIRVEDRVVSVGEVRIGYARERSRSGLSLDPIAPGVIPAGYLFAQADAPDSFDSRYAQSGLVPIGSVLGVAHPIF